MNCVLINPWIYDFAAFNLWARPLGLLKVAEYLSQFDLELRLIDCTDMYSVGKYGTGKYPRQIVEKPPVIKAVPRHFARYGMEIDEFKLRLKVHLPCDFIIVSSIMSYWYLGAREVISMVKALSPDTPVILGGIYASLHYQHAVTYSGADYVYQGHINDTINKVLSDFGLTLEKKNNPRSYYQIGLYDDYPFAPLLTGMGCPYQCSYCACQILFHGFVQFEPAVIISEIKELYNLAVRDFAFYDDALLVKTDSNLKVILKAVIDSGLKLRFHCPNGIHARYIDDELAFLMKKAGFTTIRLGFETANQKRQSDSGDKVTNSIIVRAVNHLTKYGFRKENIGIYLMYGLPEQSLTEVLYGVEFIKKLDVRINLTEFSPIPGTLYWQDLKRQGIISEDIDPLLTNNTVYSYLLSNHNPSALEKLKLDVKQYNND